MWKWIAGGVLVVIVLLAGTCYYGYRKLTAGGDTLTVMIGATPDRVYASLADPDSLSTWVDVGSTITSSRHGLAQEGDTVNVTRPPIKSGRPGPSTSYVVLAADPGHSMTVKVAGDSLERFAKITRHDSLVAVGDSTQLIITFAAEIVDPTRASVRDSGKGSQAVLGFAEKLTVAGLRLAMEQDVQRLKARVEKH